MLQGVKADLIARLQEHRDSNGGDAGGDAAGQDVQNADQEANGVEQQQEAAPAEEPAAEAPAAEAADAKVAEAPAALPDVEPAADQPEPQADSKPEPVAPEVANMAAHEEPTHKVLYFCPDHGQAPPYSCIVNNLLFISYCDEACPHDFALSMCLPCPVWTGCRGCPTCRQRTGGVRAACS